MRSRPLEFGDMTHPNAQRRLREVKGEPTQERWILLACRDKCFDLIVFDDQWDKEDRKFDGCCNMPYSALWDALSEVQLEDRKYWAIGWRMHYALDQADFEKALADGDVQLPHVKVGKGKGRHTGKLTYNRRILEVDVIAGRNKIKLLDWINFGVGLAPFTSSLDFVSLELCEKTLRDFLGMAKVADISVCKPTAAQLGWNHARRIASYSTLHVNLDPSTRQLERRAYHGGRNEAFFLGDAPGTCYSLDVKSCYAAICAEELLPCVCLEEFRAGLPVESINTKWVDHWIADVIVKTDVPDYPLRWQGTPIYPIGEFVTALAWPELRMAIDRGHVQQILSARRYDTDHVFSEYADWYFKVRALGDEDKLNRMQGVVKAMFNASLGYTAREKYDWVPWDCQIGHKYWLGTTVSPDDMQTPVAAQVLDGERRWLKIAGEPFEAMPFLHATICSYARVRLLEIFTKAGRENVLYCDTDGVLVNRAGFKALESDPGLNETIPGKLVERFEPGRARIQGQKSYSIGKNFVQAGVPKTRYSALVQKQVLTTSTGRVDVDGRAWPFEFMVERSKKAGQQWQNVMK